MTSFVLLNELTISEILNRLPSRFDLQDMDRAFVDWGVKVDKGSVSLNMRGIDCEGIGRLTSAILHEPLDRYASAAEKNPLIVNDRLSPWITRRSLKRLREHRNAIFHVGDCHSTNQWCQFA